MDVDTPRPDEKTIWQYWETRGEKPAFIDGLHAIAKKNSGVRIILVTPATLHAYLPDIEEEVLRIAEPAHKADMIRTRLILRYGGMWLDADAVVLGELNSLLDCLKHYEFVGFNNNGQLQAERPWVRVNCFLSRPGGRVVAEWVRLQRQKLSKAFFEWSEIGAALLNSACLENRPFLKILPFERICPIPWDDVAAFAIKDDARADRILAECRMVMLSNRTLKIENPPLQRRSIDEIAADDDLLGKILRSAIEGAAGGERWKIE